MLLKGRKDGFRLLIPSEFIPEPINKKYTRILQEMHSVYVKPIDVVNESIKKVDVLGVTNASAVQAQTTNGNPLPGSNRVQQNGFLHTSTEVPYRSATSPYNLVDKTLNVTFRHGLGYLAYMIIFESFLYNYHRDVQIKDLVEEFVIDIYNNRGSIFAKIHLTRPIIDGIDMLSFNYTQPIADSDEFQVTFKYSAFDYEFIVNDANTDELHNFNQD